MCNAMKVEPHRGCTEPELDEGRMLKEWLRERRLGHFAVHHECSEFHPSNAREKLVIEDDDESTFSCPLQTN